MATIILEKSAYKNNGNVELLKDNTSSGITTIYGAGVKKTVVLKFKNDGTLINPQPIDIGRVNDNRVTNLYFDLDELIWNKFHIYKKHINETTIATTDGSTTNKLNQIDEIEELFNFYLLVSPVDSDEEPQRYKFFKRNFEIPRILTKQSGILKAVVVVSERTDDDDNYPGNIPKENEYKEIFISKQFNLQVNSSIYDCEELNFQQFETAQKDSLVKPSLFATLSDNGDFNLYTDSTLTTLASNGGQKLDSFVTYVLFDGFNVTNNLKTFNNFLFFKKDKEYYYSPFQRTTDTNGHDDTRTNFIAWIPPQVSQENGEWKVCIVSYEKGESGIPFKNEKGEWEIIEPYSYKNSNYNFYVSSDVTINIESNFLINSINNYSTWNLKEETIDDAKILPTNAIYWTTDESENSLIYNKENLEYNDTKKLFDDLKELSGKTITAIPSSRDDSFYITGVVPTYQLAEDKNSIEKRTYFKLYTFEPIDCSNETFGPTKMVIGNSKDDSYQNKNNPNELYEEKLTINVSSISTVEKTIYCYTSLIKYSMKNPTGGLYDLPGSTFNLYIWKQGGNS